MEIQIFPINFRSVMLNLQSLFRIHTGRDLNVIYCKLKSCYSGLTSSQAFIDIFDIELY